MSKDKFEYEKNLSENGIDLDNPKDVNYLYKWAQHQEKAHNALIKVHANLHKNHIIVNKRCDELIKDCVELKRENGKMREALKLMIAEFTGVAEKGSMAGNAMTLARKAIQ